MDCIKKWRAQLLEAVFSLWSVRKLNDNMIRPSGIGGGHTDKHTENEVIYCYIIYGLASASITFDLRQKKSLVFQVFNIRTVLCHEIYTRRKISSGI
jgi:hypothetical protein